MARSSVESAGPQDEAAQAGFVTAQFLVAIALSLLLLSAMCNVLVQRYALAAVQMSLDEAARAGGLAGATPHDCMMRGHEALGALLGGAYGRQVVLQCHRHGTQVRAEASVRLAGWAPLVPDVVTQLRSDAAAESW